eukprot:COSAG01_NODE_1676_length_9521_cov_726.849926_9_plen_90_part_00
MCPAGPEFPIEGPIRKYELALALPDLLLASVLADVFSSKCCAGHLLAELRRGHPRRHQHANELSLELGAHARGACTLTAHALPVELRGW